MPRVSIPPGDIPPEKAARRLHLTLSEFNAILPRLLARGFPAADEDTGMYDLDAIDAWRRRRHRHLFEPAALTAAPADRNVSDLVQQRLQKARTGKWVG